MVGKGEPTMRSSSMKRILMALLSALLLGVAGCGPTPVPVTPAPLDAPKQEELRQALQGKWEWVANVKANGEEEKQPLTTYFTFNADGSFVYQTRSIVGVHDLTYAYKLDGRNVITTHPAMPTVRVESWEKDKLKLYWYAWGGLVMVLARR